MGTKENPGKFDCYSKAAPDEPMFVLLARDPSAPYLVMAWGYLQSGRLLAALAAMRRAYAEMKAATVFWRPSHDTKIQEAMDCAESMQRYRERVGVS